MSGGSARKPLVETSVAVVIQMVPAVESWHHRLEGERARLVPLLSSIDCKWRIRKVNPSQERKENYEMVISARRMRYL
jgi:hypothetical protein